MKSAKLVVHRIKAQISIVGTEMGGTGSEQSTCTVAERDLRAMHQYHADNHNLATQAVRSACHHNTPRQLRRFGMKHQEACIARLQVHAVRLSTKAQGKP